MERHLRTLHYAFTLFSAYYFVRWLLQKENRVYLLKSFFRIFKSLPGVQGVVQKEAEKALQDVENFVNSSYDSSLYGAVHLHLPAQGTSKDVLFQRMAKIKEVEWKKFQEGKAFGGVYAVNEEHVDVLNHAYTTFSSFNALYPSLFPSCRFFEVEVVQMTVSMLGCPSGVGCMTLGGTESILMALKAYRDRARLLRPDILLPEVIAPESAHPAFTKGCEYFGLKMVHIPVTERYDADLDATRAAITANTILLIGSAPGFPHGLVDPIEQLGQLAVEHGLGLHVDCCLGGFLLPWLEKLGKLKKKFDFRVPGVSSISCDVHKFGFAHKGASCILYRDASLRRFQFSSYTDWPGGLYCSPSISGSRPGGLIAQAWAGLHHIGQEGFLVEAEKNWKVFNYLKEEIRKIPELFLVGEADACAIAFSSSILDIYQVAEAMSSRFGWHIDCIHRPKCIHIVVTASQSETIRQYIDDLRTSVALVKATPSDFNKGMAPVYGMAATLPDREIVGDLLKGFLDTVYRPPKDPLPQ